MSESAIGEWKLYGGAGFIGQHLALNILSLDRTSCVTLLDIQPKNSISWRVSLQSFLDEGRLEIRTCDVRKSEDLRESASTNDILVNLAAIHREPGHRPEEYFETNIKGAENICRLAEETGCREIIFTSSISVYGVQDRSVDEHSTPEPKTPYGQSKPEAERIHRASAENLTFNSFGQAFRVAKLTRANDVRPAQLITDGYPFNWPLERALADWLEKGI